MITWAIYRGTTRISDGCNPRERQEAWLDGEQQQGRLLDCHVGKYEYVSRGERHRQIIEDALRHPEKSEAAIKDIARLYDIEANYVIERRDGAITTPHGA